MLQIPRSTVRNRLLNALAPDDFEALVPMMERVPVTLHQVLQGQHEPIDHVLFVEQGLVSFVADTQSGRIEIGLVGREGFVGIPVVLGADRGSYMAIVQGEGEVLRIEAQRLRSALDSSPDLRDILGRYVQSFIVQMGQTVYANIELNIEGRLARWILMVHDRLDRDELPLTHEFLAMMLGVRRPGVTTATHVLEGAGLIQAKRGRITVLDREKLQELVGDTYGLAEAEYERLLAEA